MRRRFTAREKLFAAANEAGRDRNDLTLVAFGLPGALRSSPEAEELREFHEIGDTSG